MDWFPNPTNPAVPVLGAGWEGAEVPAEKELDANGLLEDDPKPDAKLNPVEPLPPKEKEAEPTWLGWLGAWLAPGKLWL